MDKKIYALPTSAASNCGINFVCKPSFEVSKDSTQKSARNPIILNVKRTLGENASSSNNIYALSQSSENFLKSGSGKLDSGPSNFNKKQDPLFVEKEPSAPDFASLHSVATSAISSQSRTTLTYNPIPKTTNFRTNIDKVKMFHPGVKWQKFPFNKAVIGSNSTIDNSFQIISRLDVNASNGYAFSANPLRTMQTLLIQVVKVDSNLEGSLTFGMTACDPSNMSGMQLPEDHDNMCDLPQYWVCKENLDNSPNVGDVLAFTLLRDGRVYLQRNDEPKHLLMHVDASVKLWMFLDVLGETVAVSSVGTYTAKDTFDPLQKSSGDENKEPEDCVICMDKQKECAAIPCGHYSMCNYCASQIMKTTKRCPMCQGKINSIQKIYK